MVRWATVYEHALKRFNCCDGASISVKFLSELLEHHAGTLPISTLPMLLNSYELACFERRFGAISNSGKSPSGVRCRGCRQQQPHTLEPSADVYLVPVTHHMRRRPPLHRDCAAAAAAWRPDQPALERSACGRRERTGIHREVWLMLLLSEVQVFPRGIAQQPRWEGLSAAPAVEGVQPAEHELPRWQCVVQWLWPVKRESELVGDSDGRFRTLEEFIQRTRQEGEADVRLVNMEPLERPKQALGAAKE
jgi:hypothetical protein